ncbi:Oidioi.mRNA.OKI2018_I69.XSR.g16872.t1.cds [Oikopleura dioica]|uniref:Oidioi.mRNA.OKI2018_I69.XSR.g16872.t1.cds n=1 Tax=Oikopleura dioica TaxID=34765 RepID=A0ABN7SHZ3_OIKDI|nr:Oidioi.mRNA.OKI2018_I69.XSR.g16872.t1.cds [Oikopleura dioica]
MSSDNSLALNLQPECDYRLDELLQKSEDLNANLNDLPRLKRNFGQTLDAVERLYQKTYQKNTVETAVQTAVKTSDSATNTEAYDESDNTVSPEESNSKRNRCLFILFFLLFILLFFPVVLASNESGKQQRSLECDSVNIGKQQRQLRQLQLFEAPTSQLPDGNGLTDPGIDSSHGEFGRDGASGRHGDSDAEGEKDMPGQRGIDSCQGDSVGLLGSGAPTLLSKIIANILRGYEIVMTPLLSLLS